MRYTVVLRTSSCKKSIQSAHWPLHSFSHRTLAKGNQVLDLHLLRLNSLGRGTLNSWHIYTQISVSEKIFSLCKRSLSYSALPFYLQDKGQSTAVITIHLVQIPQLLLRSIHNSWFPSGHQMKNIRKSFESHDTKIDDVLKLR